VGVERDDMDQDTQTKAVKVAVEDIGSKRILIVEDDPSIVDVLLNLLELVLGQQEVFVAQDGYTAIQKAYECNPELILMDLSLPKMNGWEVTRSLKSNPRFQRVPILAMTAHAMIGDREKALDAGCNDYYAKPIEVDEFIHFMRPYLSV
jgi:CheY-like chemotaxis protein